MPYIITHRAHGDIFEDGAGITRTAVATLDEAADTVEAIIIEHDPNVMPAIHAPDLADGGTVGPLPDGTVIEVQRVSWPYLRGLTRSISRRRIGPEPDHVVAVFNAAQVQA